MTLSCPATTQQVFQMYLLSNFAEETPSIFPCFFISCNFSPWDKCKMWSKGFCCCV